MKKILIKIIYVVIVVFVFVFVMDIITHFEKYSTTARYHLMLDLNAGDKTALEYYKKNYTDNDIYLYNGNISFSLFAENNNISNNEYDILYNEYKNSGLTLQQFADNYNK